MIKAIVWQATNAAVSVRNLVVPNVTGIKLFSVAKLISLVEKSPSGPIKIVTFSSFISSFLNDFLSVSSQCAINFCPTVFNFINSVNEMGLLIFGI